MSKLLATPWGFLSVAAVCLAALALSEVVGRSAPEFNLELSTHFACHLTPTRDDGAADDDDDDDDEEDD